MLKNLLEKKNCFKLVCGAGKEDSQEVKRLVYLYALAGVRFFDLSANLEVIDCAKRALELANIKDACISVSIGIKNDPHVKKAFIDYSRCVNCGACEEICPEKAIRYAKVIKNKCIGCGRCWKICSRTAINYISEEKDLEFILPDIICAQPDCIEFHVMGLNDEEIFEKWEYLTSNYDGMLSICTSRVKLSDEKLIERIKNMLKTRKPYTTIIQADGFPMSGGEDDYNSTLQAVATAQIVQREDLPVYIMLSGGTNSKTSELANLCNIDYNGIAVGSYARKIAKDYIERKDFWDNENIIQQALLKIQPLVNSVLKKN